MDSGNSGSVQSSSGGGDEELNSSRRKPSISAFFSLNSHFLTNQNPNLFIPPQTQNLHLHLDHHRHHHQHPLPYSNGLVWSSGISQQTYPIFVNSAPSSSSSLPPGPDSNSRDNMTSAATTRNPKKRSRASRRAPTTVLTTDPSNFRQMVQEFTGIPTAPFSGYPYSRGMDLFFAATAALQPGRRNSTVIPTNQNHLLNPESHDSNIQIPMNFGNPGRFQTTSVNIHDGFKENEDNLVTFDGNISEQAEENGGPRNNVPSWIFPSD